jgi:hypothetical protein
MLLKEELKRLSLMEIWSDAFQWRKRELKPDIDYSSKISIK